ncbi:TetR/AcrR family transcriptional regulator [Microcella pacifica]|uniref:TetR/AcrR family transcriptional regulator n=1 Tax=Microcella pacifica TaxID=2591847 RepID=A0A9E5JMC4_9MICO|nr:TetR/AcrR family transcriptional regulator [Microcella pacifica]NHF62145.1 TetR/AcrR family transcriptional regulator [Microcella pacifica]
MVAVTKNGRSAPTSERRDELLAIAARLIATRGFSATTVRDVADEAGILSGSLYHHFSSKEAILAELLKRFMTTLLDRFEKIAAETDSPREALDLLVDQAFRTIESEPDAVGIYQNESSFLATQQGFEFVSEHSARIEQIWMTAIRDGQASGDFRASVDPAITYRFIRDSVWATGRWFRPGGRHTAESLSAHYLDFLHQGLLAD